MPGVILLQPGAVFADPNQQAVHTNATVNASSSQVFTGYGASEVSLFINVKAAPTGTLPTLQFTIQEVDPGDGTTVIGTSVSSTVINAAGIQRITLESAFGGSIKVSWVIGGTSSPTFTQVYSTLVAKSASIKIVDATGAAISGTNPLRTDPTGTTTQPVSGTVTANQGTAAAAAGSWPVEMTDGTNVLGVSAHPVRIDPTGTTTQPVSAASLPLPAGAATAANQTTLGSQTTEINDGTRTATIKAASTASVATDTSLVTALSPNSPLPAGTNALGTVTAAQATAANLNATAAQGAPGSLANAWPHEITDGTHGPAAVKAASTAAVAADPALVVAVSPNNTVPVSAASLPLPAGAATASNQISLGAQTTELNDGTHTATIKAASTAAVAADTALVVAVSPNNTVPVSAASLPLPAGAATASNQTSLGAQTTELNDGTHTATIKAASTAAVAADTALVVAVSPNNTVPVSAASLPLPAGAATSANQTTLGNQTTKINDGTNTASVKAASTAAVAADPALVVAVSPNNTVPVSAASLPLPAGAATSANQTTVGNQTTKINDGINTAAVKAASTAAVAADPSLVVAVSPNSPLPAGTNIVGSVKVTDGINIQPTGDAAVRAIFEKITDGINTAAVKAASTAAVAADPALVVALSPNTPSPGVADVTATGALGALNAAVQITLAGLAGTGFQLAAGTLIGTIVAEISYDSGTTWSSTPIDVGNKVNSLVFSSANPATTAQVIGAHGAGLVRIRVSAYTSGTANITLRGSQCSDPAVEYAGIPGATTQPPVAAQMAGWDGTTLRAANVKAGNTAPAATDQALVVTVSPNSPSASVIPSYPTGAIADHRFGFSAGAGTPQDIRATAYTEQTTGAQRSMKSTSANDVNTTGTGAWQVVITYYKSDLTGPFTTTVNLNGTTAVTTTATDICFVESMIVLTAGTLKANAGTISLYANTLGTGTVIGSIGFGLRNGGIGDRQTFWAHHYIQPGKIFYLAGMSTSMVGVTVGLTYGAFVNPLTANAVEVIKTPMIGSRQAFGDYPYKISIPIAGPGRFTLYNSATGGNEVDSSFEFVEA